MSKSQESQRKNQSIEKNIKLIALVGAALLVALTATLIIVQIRLGDSQARLTERIVPTQRKLGELTAAVGELFLRQNEIVAADAANLEKFKNRVAQETAIQSNHSALRVLLSSPELRNHPAYPKDSIGDIQRDVEAFLHADSELYNSAEKGLIIHQQFTSAVASLDSDLKMLMIDSAGAAGVLRLEYVASLRRINQQLDKHELDETEIRAAVVGDARVQLSTISELDTAVLRLGVLAGKVGLAASQDSMNSLIANELSQNRQQIQESLEKLVGFTSGSKIAGRIASMRAVALELADRVGNESHKDSLASIRREMLAQDQQVLEIQSVAALTARNLNAHIDTLREFTEALAHDANRSASATIWGSRLATVIVTIVGLVLSVSAGMRVGQSVVALRSQNEDLAELSAKLSAANTNLEAIVAERTASLQMILDNTGEGVLSVGLDGVLLPEQSKTVTKWCGKAHEGAKLWDYLGAEDEEFASNLEIAFEQIASQVFPFEVAAGQAPEKFTLHGRCFSLGFREILESGHTTKVLVLIRDITRQLESERIETEARELHKLIGNLLKDQSGFHQHLEESAGLIASIMECKDSLVSKRLLHTVKGNTAILGFQRIADWIHELESRLAEEKRLPSETELQSLEKLWTDSLSQISDYLIADLRDVVELQPSQIDELLELVSENELADQIHQLVEYWNFESIAVHLNRLAKNSVKIAERVGKELRVVVEDHGVRLPYSCLKNVWPSLIHVIRNAVDHGLESPSERIAASKPIVGTIKLSASTDGDLLKITISDDGQGINWDGVRQRAMSFGLEHHSQERLVDALFHDGLSTSEMVTELSGRGVGLSAVRQACSQVNGTIAVESSQLAGTAFIFIFDLRKLSSVLASDDSEMPERATKSIGVANTASNSLDS